MHRSAQNGVRGRSERTLHLYAAAPAETMRLADWAAGIGGPLAIRLHVERVGAELRPALMSLLVEAQPGDLICAAGAEALAAAPPRARTRLATAIRSRGVGVALVDADIGIDQAVAGSVNRAASAAALEAIAAIAPVRPRARTAAAPARTGSAEAVILSLLNAGRTWSQVQAALGVTRAQVAACARRLAAVDAAQSSVQQRLSAASGDRT